VIKQGIAELRSGKTVDHAVVKNKSRHIIAAAYAHKAQ
jgi:hypothetical protein